VSAIADSCALIAFLADPQVSARMPRAFPLMQSGEVYVPPLVVWEIGRLVVIGRLPPISAPLPGLLRRCGFNALDMPWEVAALAETLPMIHRDPVDRIIVAHSRVQGMPVLTCDTVIPQYGVRTIW
jgi:PIN domain nuclease of toxin-antitoxin system